MSVARAQQEVDALEFAEWVAYLTLESSGEERADVRTAIVLEYILAALGFKQRNGKRFTAKELYADLSGDAAEQRRKAAETRKPTTADAYLAQLDAALKHVPEIKVTKNGNHRQRSPKPKVKQRPVLKRNQER